jgi:hypothetical protein
MFWASSMTSIRGVDTCCSKAAAICNSKITHASGRPTSSQRKTVVSVGLNPTREDQDARVSCAADQPTRPIPESSTAVCRLIAIRLTTLARRRASLANPAACPHYVRRAHKVGRVGCRSIFREPRPGRGSGAVSQLTAADVLPRRERRPVIQEIWRLP